MKQNLKIILIAFVLLCGIHSTPALALKRAIFPDSKSLQPLPADARANISGNINSTVNDTVIDPDVEETAPGSPVTEPIVPHTQIEGNSTSTIVIWSIIIFLALVALFSLYYKRNRK